MKLNIIMIEGFYRPNRTFAGYKRSIYSIAPIIGKNWAQGLLEDYTWIMNVMKHCRRVLAGTTYCRLHNPTKNELYVEDKMDYIVDE